MKILPGESKNQHLFTCLLSFIELSNQHASPGRAISSCSRTIIALYNSHAFWIQRVREPLLYEVITNNLNLNHVRTTDYMYNGSQNWKKKSASIHSLLHPPTRIWWSASIKLIVLKMNETLVIYLHLHNCYFGSNCLITCKWLTIHGFGLNYSNQLQRHEYSNSKYRNNGRKQTGTRTNHANFYMYKEVKT